MVYKTKPFARFARKASISDAELLKAAQLANDGVIDADLGGGVIKKRIARKGEGKSGVRVRSTSSERMIERYLFTDLKRKSQQHQTR